MSHVLTYDTLPAHSRLRREYSQGVLKITATVEEPGPMVRRTAMRRAVVPAGLILAFTMVFGVVAFGSMFHANRPQIAGGLRWALLIAVAVFYSAIFALIWFAQYRLRLDAAQLALRQRTILAASPGRLLIETAGPEGEASHDLGSGDGELRIVSISTGTCNPRVRVDCLQILLSDGRSIAILPGRDEHELRWVARALTRAIGV